MRVFGDKGGACVVVGVFAGVGVVDPVGRNNGVGVGAKECFEAKGCDSN